MILDKSTLLILDRRDDPITPLLLNWSYLSMINEMFLLENNRLDLRSVEDIDPELREVTLSTIHDRFYANNMYSGFGDIAGNAKNYSVFSSPFRMAINSSPVMVSFS